MTASSNSQLDTLLASGEAGEYEQACEAQLSRTCKKPSFHELVKHMDRFGPDCVLASALHLPTDQYAALERRVSHVERQNPKPKRMRMRTA